MSIALRLPIAPRAGRLIERNLLVYKHGWLVIASGLAEPLLYLFAIGFGLGSLVGTVESGGRAVPYAVFVAPALMASSAMNGAVAEATFNLFHKLRYAKIYDSVLATPVGPVDVAVGEVAWALLRGAVYATCFLAVMAAARLVASPLALLMVPGAVLIGFAFAAACMAATTFMRSWQDFDLVQLTMVPLFLFSATFFPLSTYPGPLQVVVELTPLYHGVDLLRALAVGSLGWAQAVDVAYLLALGAAGVLVTSRRLQRLLLR